MQPAEQAIRPGADCSVLSKLDPFPSAPAPYPALQTPQEAKPYKQDPEIVAMTNLVAAFQRNDINDFEKILRKDKCVAALPGGTPQTSLPCNSSQSHVELVVLLLCFSTFHRCALP